MPKKLSIDTVHQRCKKASVECLVYSGNISASSTFRCKKCLYIWQTAFNHISQGHGCPKCAKCATPTIEDVAEYCNSRTFKCKQWSGYSQKKSLWECECGYEWWATFSSIKNRQSGCRKCAGLLPILEQEANNSCGLLGFHIYKWGGSARKKSIFECDICKHKWITKFEYINASKCGCPKCAGTIKQTLNDAITFCLNRSVKPIPEEWGGNAKALSGWICECGHKWKAKFSDLKNRKIGCGKCVGTAIILPEDVIAYCRTKTFKLVSWGGAASKISIWKCDCSHVWKAKFSDIKNKGCSCPRCAKLYQFNDIMFDSSWELIFYLYHLKLNHHILRINREKEYCLKYEFNGSDYKWYPDFIVDGIMYEIKPKNDYWGGRERNNAKRLAHQKVQWVTNKDIKEMSKVVGDVSGYRQNKKIK